LHILSRWSIRHLIYGSLKVLFWRKTEMRGRERRNSLHTSREKQWIKTIKAKGLLGFFHKSLVGCWENRHSLQMKFPYHVHPEGPEDAEWRKTLKISICSSSRSVRTTCWAIWWSMVPPHTLVRCQFTRRQWSSCLCCRAGRDTKGDRLTLWHKELSHRETDRNPEPEKITALWEYGW
jgi:hypothetical protein